MPIEIEAKLKVDDLEAVRALLHSSGAVPIGRFFETNIFFDTPERKLLNSDAGLRLRIDRDLQSNNSTYILTHKGPRLHGPLKSRQETELAVADPDAAVALLEQLGFVRLVSFEKKRESWRLADCRVELDEVPHLGTFVEVEGPSEDSVLKVRQTLKLANRPILKSSYIAMLMDYLKSGGQSPRDITFST